MIVAHEQTPGGVVAAQQFLDPQPQPAPVGAELDDDVVDDQADPPNQLEPLHHRQRVTQRDDVPDLGA